MNSPISPQQTKINTFLHKSLHVFPLPLPPLQGSDISAVFLSSAAAFSVSQHLVILCDTSWVRRNTSLSTSPLKFVYGTSHSFSQHYPKSQLCPIFPLCAYLLVPSPYPAKFCFLLLWRTATSIRGKTGHLPFCSPVLSCFFLAEKLVLVATCQVHTQLLSLLLLQRTGGR